MKTSVYLILNRMGVVAARKNKPYLTSGQVAVKLDIDISDKFFERFVPSATLKIADHQVIAPDIKVQVHDPVMDRLMGEDEKDAPF